MRSGVFLAVLGAALAAAGCKPSPASKRRVFMDARQVVRVKVGEEFGLSVSYNPTVSPDYRHELQEPLPPCLAFVTTEYESSDPHSRKTGVGGFRTWILKALSAGEAKVTFACRAKSHAPDPVVFTVEVAP